MGNIEFEARELRTALGRFATGVTIVTALAADGRPVGLTVNSFASVSLDPPIVSWCLQRGSSLEPVFRQARHFAVNVLSEDQRGLSARFAAPVADRFDGIAWTAGTAGVPKLDGCLACFECTVADRLAIGDHQILLGRVDAFHHADGDPLVFYAGRFGVGRSLALVS